jgi:NhaA family Na+:H+ antiporter
MIRKALDRAVDPFGQFIKKESSSSIIMIGAMTLALFAANSGFKEVYDALLTMKFGFSIGDFSLYKDLILWINDGLMALFFLVVGLELKRELLIGELSSPDKALVPIVAAIGGAVIPALIFFAFNYGRDSIAGWGIPMATDIAFALGILALIKNTPSQLKIFLTSLAVVDDMIAVLVITLFYTDTVNMAYLYYSGAAVLLLLIMNRVKILQIGAYLTIGVFLWYFLLKSGVHATIAGVILAAFIPAQPKISLKVFARLSERQLEGFKASPDDPTTDIVNKYQKKYLNNLIHTALHAYNPMSRLEYNLHGITAFFVMPVFAFFNMGLGISASDFSALLSPMSLGIILGLFVGKPLGIVASVLIFKKMNIISLPKGISMRHITGAGMLAGIGLTMSIFISAMAYSADTSSEAKMAILAASIMSGLVGYIYLKKID